MCGIAGYTASLPATTLDHMLDRLHPRGPDQRGRFDGAVHLGIARLSIVDLASGSQPVFNEDQRIVAVFNGEIYNHRELRSLLEARGHTLRSHHSDSEVIVHLFEEFGIEFLHHLNGMFAIALWDDREQSLWLARDRAGVKPLYLTQPAQHLLFASEIKALLAALPQMPAPNAPAIYDYFSFKHVPAPATAFEGITVLPPGCWLRWHNGQVQQQRWWRYPATVNAITDAPQRIHDTLDSAVALRLAADVPVGAYLSGGVDSSAVVALMRRHSSAPIPTFTLTYQEDFPGKTADRNFARRVAKLFGTEHHELLLTAADLADSLPAVVAAMDDPFAGVTSTYPLTRLIARHVKVCLSGDGADELFGSYLPHRLAQPLAAWHHARISGGPLPTAALGEFAEAPDTLQRWYRQGDLAAQRLACTLAEDPAKRRLLSDNLLAQVGAHQSDRALAGWYAEYAACDPLNQVLAVDFNTLLPDQVLHYADRLSMANSVEIRSPFMDYRLIELAAQLPGPAKIVGRRVKSLLKDAVADLLPADLVERPKEGFVLPLNYWLGHDLAPLVADVLAPPRLARSGLLRPSGVEDLRAQFAQAPERHGPLLWAVLMAQLWWEHWYT